PSRPSVFQFCLLSVGHSGVTLRPHYRSCLLGARLRPLEQNVYHPSLGRTLPFHSSMGISIVVATLACRINSCTTLTSLPFSASSELYVCRKVCQPIGLAIPTLRATR